MGIILFTGPLNSQPTYTKGFQITSNPLLDSSTQVFGTDIINYLAGSLLYKTALGIEGFLSILGELYDSKLSTQEVSVPLASVTDVSVIKVINSIESLQELLTTVGGKLLSYQRVLSPLGDSSVSVIKVIEALSTIINISTGLGELFTFKYSSPLRNTHSFQQLVNSFSDSISSVQNIISNLTNNDPFHGSQVGNVPLGQTSLFVSLNELSGNVKGLQSIVDVLSGDPVKSTQELSNLLAVKDILNGTQEILNMLSPLGSTTNINTPYDILVDGVSIKNRIESCTISISQKTIHNSIEFSSKDMALYHICDPQVNFGARRIIVRVGSRVLSFLIEERSGEEYNFKIWGRSLSALDDSPFKQEESIVVDSPTMASAIMAPYLTNTLEWNAPDWMVPVGVSFSATPIQGIRTIAKQIGAIVNSDDQGNIIVSRKLSVRPVDIASTSPHIQYNRNDHLITLNVNQTNGKEYNVIDIYGYSGDVEIPDLELEEPCVIKGQPCHVRAYWKNGSLPTVNPTVYLTDGEFTDEGFKTEIITNETVEFRDGKATLSKPVTLLDPTNIAWIGADGGDVTWKPYTKNLSIENNAYRIATITYTTTYKRYNLHGHNVSKLMQILAVPPSTDIFVILIQGNGGNKAPDIHSTWLSSDDIAREAGTAWLDNNKYPAIVVDITVPYSDNALISTIADIEDGVIFISGKAYITDANIQFDGPKVTNKLSLKQYIVT